jgi:hypothetical protein
MSVNLTDVQTDLAYLLGEQSAPATTNSDYVVRQTFIQRALERAYRAYPFGFNRLTATVSLTSGIATLASSVMQDSILDVRQVITGTNNDNVYERVTNTDSDNYPQGNYKYWLTGYQGALLLNSVEADTTLTYRYTTSAPVLNASISTPFPSSMALARGALIYYRQAEDPQADVAQEEALFSGELSEIISQFNRSRPQRRLATNELDIPEL